MKIEGILFVTGEVALNGLRVNQVELSRQLAGTFQFSNTDVHIHAKVGHSGLCCLTYCWLQSYCRADMQLSAILWLRLSIQMHKRCMTCEGICRQGESSTLSIFTVVRRIVVLTMLAT